MPQKGSDKGKTDSGGGGDGKSGEAPQQPMFVKTPAVKPTDSGGNPYSYIPETADGITEEVVAFTVVPVNDGAKLEQEEQIEIVRQSEESGALVIWLIIGLLLAIAIAGVVGLTMWRMKNSRELKEAMAAQELSRQQMCEPDD